MFGEFKEVMTKEFEMTDIGLMAYYLGIEVNQREDGSFISQAGYAREILKKFRMDNSKSINTPVECGVKLSKHDEEEKVDPTFFKSLVGSLRYLTCTRPDILYAVGLVSRYMEDPTTTHLKIAKRILRYIKGTIDFGLFYSTSNHFKLEGYSDSDWGGDIDDRKSTTGFVFFMGDTTFTWMSKKQPIVTLSTCEAEYVAATSFGAILGGEPYSREVQPPNQDGGALNLRDNEDHRLGTMGLDERRHIFCNFATDIANPDATPVTIIRRIHVASR
ncbi:hypothetical protein ZIOFF_008964 [Zingiber officinale]|uniref:Reverse transcriptase Ty1/copia-type domain-containing protein n=1 Tax=Zingiber officinale TaxID=94328 RepID=A0A8J5LVQ5_ZINOF|nr:hypothetical protein ZIOFF_008964 [Zingiber officinale]